LGSPRSRAVRAAEYCAYLYEIGGRATPSTARTRPPETEGREREMSPRQRGPRPHHGGPQQQRGPADGVGPPAPSPAPDECATLTPLITAIEQIRNSRVIVYWTSPAARVSAGVAMSLYDQLIAIGKTERIDLVLLTNGGDTDAPWRIVSLIREFCDRTARQ
jgi:hypothetical protein